MSICVELNVQQLHILMIGGGNIALRKTRAFLQEGAFVHVVAWSILPELQQLATSWQQRAVELKDLDDIDLLVAASDEQALNHRWITLANQRQILTMSVHQDEEARLHAMRFVNKQNYVLACSTKGAYPMLGKVILDDFTQQMEQTYAPALSLYQQLRQHLFKLQKSDVQKRQILTQLLEYNQTQLAFLVKVIQTKGHVLVFHGVRDQTAQKDIQQAVNTLQETLQAPVSYAFLSKSIIADVSHVFDAEALCQLTHELGASLHLYPMFLQHGHYATQVQNLAQTYGFGLAPLPFDKQAKAQRLLDHLINTYGSKMERLLLVLHGGSDCHFLATLQACASAYPNVRCAFEHDAVPEAKEHCIPLFLLYGAHAKKFSTQAISCFHDSQIRKMIIEHILEQSV